MLHDAIDEPKEEVQSSSQSNSNGKVLVKSTNPVKKYSDDIGEILQAFISCSILSFVTAGMGVGWLLYIIMHIWFFISIMPWNDIILIFLILKFNCWIKIT